MIGHNLKTGLVNVNDRIKRTNRGQMIDSPDFSQLKILVDPNAGIRNYSLKKSETSDGNRCDSINRNKTITPVMMFTPGLSSKSKLWWFIKLVSVTRLMNPAR